MSSWTGAEPEPLPAALGYIRPTGKLDTSISEASIEHVLTNFSVRKTDVILATFPKTGTTLLQWISHLLRSDCNTDDFEDLYQVVPWLITAWDLNQDLAVDGCQFTPRLYKSHLRLASEMRGCKYIVTIRDPLKTTLSFYNFFLNKGHPLGTGKTPSQFLRETGLVRGREGRPSIWDFYSDYYIARDCSSVLVVVYEDLVKDKRSYVKLISHFMGVSATPDLIDKVCKLSSKQAMSRYDAKMNETWVYKRLLETGRSPDVTDWQPASRVVVDEHDHFMDEEGHRFLAQQWRDQVEARTGFSSYADMARFFRQRNALKLWQYEAQTGKEN